MANHPRTAPTLVAEPGSPTISGACRGCHEPAHEMNVISRAESRCAHSALRRVRLVAGKLRQDLLACGFASHERDEVFRRVGSRDSHAERLHALAERLGLNNFVQLLVEISDNGCWRLGRCSEADEAPMVEIRIAELIHRWHLGPG